MPEWLTAGVGVVAIVIATGFTEIAVRGYISRAEGRTPSRQRTVVTSIALVVAVVVLVGIVWYVFAS